MPLIDLILNLAALLLWLNWRAIDFETIRSPRVSIVSNLKKLNRSPSRWIFFIILVSLLILRAVIYWQLGSSLDWVAAIPLGPTTLHFRSDYFSRILLFSFLSFGIILGIFYLGLLLLSIVNAAVSDADPMQKLVRLHLGWLERLPVILKLFVPILIPTVLWIVLSPVFLKVKIIPQPKDFPHILEQGLVIGINAYLVWKYYLIALLVLYTLNNYIYFGTAPVWGYISQTGRKLLVPLHWLPLRIGRLDFTPALAIAAIFFVAKYAELGLVKLYGKLTV